MARSVPLPVAASNPDSQHQVDRVAGKRPLTPFDAFASDDDFEEKGE